MSEPWKERLVHRASLERLGDLLALRSNAEVDFCGASPSEAALGGIAEQIRNHLSQHKEVFLPLPPSTMSWDGIKDTIKRNIKTINEISGTNDPEVEQVLQRIDSDLAHQHDPAQVQLLNKAADLLGKASIQQKSHQKSGNTLRLKFCDDYGVPEVMKELQERIAAYCSERNMPKPEVTRINAKEYVLHMDPFLAATLSPLAGSKTGEVCLAF